jgi:hypothetical protein
MSNSSTWNLPSPVTGRPLITVNQITYALRSGAVFSELENGDIVQVYQARRQKGVFQVKLGEKRWAASPKRVWAAKTAVHAPPSGKIHVTRTPVGERSLDDLLTLAFQVPVWIEAPDGDPVIFPQSARRRLSLKRWSHQDHPILVAKTFGELAAFMREQESLSQLLDQNEQTPFRAWQIATPTTAMDASSPGGN